MTACTSGKAHHDPKPWVNYGEDGIPNAYGRHPRYSDCSALCRYEPRPKFDNHNPILVELRSRADSLRGLEMEAAYDRVNDAAWKKAGCPEFGQDGFTEWCAYEDHAWRVMERLCTDAGDECECSDPFTASLTGHGHACPLYDETE
jgi:hypothetical protein